MIDLRPAAERTTGVLVAVTDDQLGLPTPCPEMSVGDVVDHLGVVAVAFGAAAGKEAGPGTSPPPPPGGSTLEPGWRDRIARDLAALAEAWRDPRAWEGSTHAGGIEMPGAVAALVALDELVVHGWDVAVATGRGRAYEPGAGEVGEATAFVSSFEAPRDGGLFGPVVPVPEGASPFERLLGLTGRDPAWRPGA